MPRYIESGGKYYVTVHGFSEGSNEFSVTGSFGDTPVYLKEGVPLTETLMNGNYRYYKFYDTSPRTDLLFDVAPLTGDPDLYISCRLRISGDDEGYPSQKDGHFNHSSVMMYEDAIRVIKDPTSASYTTTCNKVERGGGVMYYLAVFAFDSSMGLTTEYTITALHASGAVTLTNGIPFDATVFRNQ